MGCRVWGVVHDLFIFGKESTDSGMATLERATKMRTMYHIWKNFCWEPTLQLVTPKHYSASWVCVSWHKKQYYGHLHVRQSMLRYPCVLFIVNSVIGLMHVSCVKPFWSVSCVAYLSPACIGWWLKSWLNDMDTSILALPNSRKLVAKPSQNMPIGVAPTPFSLST